MATASPPSASAPVKTARFFNPTVGVVLVRNEHNQDIQVWPWMTRGDKQRGKMPIILEGEFWDKYVTEGGKGPLARFPDPNTDPKGSAPRQVSGVDAETQQAVRGLLGADALTEDVASALQFVLARAGGREIACSDRLTKYQPQLLNIARGLSHRPIGIGFDNSRRITTDEEGNHWIRSQRQFIDEESTLRTVRDAESLDSTHTKLAKNKHFKASALFPEMAPPRIKLEGFSDAEFNAFDFEVVENSQTVHSSPSNNPTTSGNEPGDAPKSTGKPGGTRSDNIPVGAKR